MPFIERYKGHLIYDTRESNYKVLEGRETFEVFHEATGALTFRFHAYYNPRQFLLLNTKEKAIQRILARILPEIRSKIATGNMRDEMRHVIFTRKELLDSSPAPAITLPERDTAQNAGLR